MDLPLGSLGDPNVLPVYPAMDAVKWLPCQPDIGLSLPNLSKKVPKAGEQQSAAGGKEEARKNNFSSGIAGAGPGSLGMAGSCINGRCENVPAPT